MAIEGVGCHAGKGGGVGQIFKKKERKERTREVTVRAEIICVRFLWGLLRTRVLAILDQHEAAYSWR